jgi:hypothetical protein
MTIDRTADAMFRNYDEARHWVQDADLRETTLVLEDRFDDELVATARINGAHDRYKVEITNHEGERSTNETVVDATEVAEMIGGWDVAGRTDTDTGN